jgi:diadenosine tetraphosphate (Ap4A) HIT family hydrolase
MEHYEEMDKSDANDGVIGFVWKRHKANLHKLSRANIIALRHLCR